MLESGHYEKLSYHTDTCVQFLFEKVEGMHKPTRKIKPEFPCR